MGIVLKLNGNCEGCKIDEVYLAIIKSVIFSQMRMEEILKETQKLTPTFTPLETWPPLPSWAQPWNCGSALDYKDIKFDYVPEPTPADLLKKIQEEMKGRP